MKKYILLLAAALFINPSIGHADDREPVEIKKTKRDLGRIAVVRTDVNPEKQTRLVFESCSHPGIGVLKNCNGYLYEMSEEGWLSKDRISFSQTNNQSINLAAGKYYMKMSSYQARTYYATGEISIVPFVTNFVHVALE
jgi:hypothetical protein